MIYILINDNNINNYNNKEEIDIQIVSQLSNNSKSINSNSTITKFNLFIKCKCPHFNKKKETEFEQLSIKLSILTIINV